MTLVAYCIPLFVLLSPSQNNVWGDGFADHCFVAKYLIKYPIVHFFSGMPNIISAI